MGCLGYTKREFFFLMTMQFGIISKIVKPRTYGSQCSKWTLAGSVEIINRYAKVADVSTSRAYVSEALCRTEGPLFLGQKPSYIWGLTISI